MSFFKSIFSAPSMIKNISNGIDKMIFTDEERADILPNLLKLYEPYKIAQRWLMVIVCGPYFFLWFLVGLGTLIIEVFSFSGSTANTREFLFGPIVYLVGTIISFYFGGGAIEGIIGKFKKKDQSK